MKNVQTHIGNIVSMNRLSSSTNGNPRYIVELKTTKGSNMVFRTAVDSAIAYKLPNYNKPEELVLVEVGSHYGVDTLANIKWA